MCLYFVTHKQTNKDMSTCQIEYMPFFHLSAVAAKRILPQLLRLFPWLLYNKSIIRVGSGKVKLKNEINKNTSQRIICCACTETVAE